MDRFKSKAKRCNTCNTEIETMPFIKMLNAQLDNLSIPFHSIPIAIPFTPFLGPLYWYNRLAISCVNNADAWSVDNKLQLGD